jgi:sugar-phosphatase
VLGRRIEAAIFDMDGLLVDTEQYWHQAEIEILSDLGVAMDEQSGRSTKGMRVDEVVARYFSLHPWTGPSQHDVVEMILSRVGDLAEAEGSVLPGVRHTFSVLDAVGLPMALASSTPRRLIDRILAHFNLSTQFQTISSAEAERYGKPHPAVFLTAAASVGATPMHCVVFEDAPAGVLAAKAAQMACVAVPDPSDRDHPMIQIADVVLSSLEDFSVEVLSGLNSR